MVDPKAKKNRRCDHECKDHRHDAVPGRKHIPSHPADPRQRVGNAQREPSPYVDLQSKPNITGTYFGGGGRYRLFINHVGGHIECLLTLVTRQLKYQAKGRKNKPASGRDPRLPDVWGPLQGDRNPPPLAFRFSGEANDGGQFLLEVPPWMLRKAGALDPDGQLSIFIGTLDPRSNEALDLVFDPGFVDAWPEHQEAATSQAFRANPDPVLLERYLDQPWVSNDVRSSLWFTRTPLQRDAIPGFAARILTHTVNVNDNFIIQKKGGKPKTLVELVEAAMALGYGSDIGSQIDNHRRNNIVTSIDRLVGDVFEGPLGVPFALGGLALDDLEELRPLVLDHLANTGVAGKTTLLSGLARTVDDSSKFKTTTDYLSKYLGIEKRGWGKHEYRVRVDLFQITDFNDEAKKKTAEGTKKAIEELLKKLESSFERLKTLKRFSPISTLVGTAVVEYTGKSVWHGKDGPEDYGESGWRGDYTLVLVGLQHSRGMGDGTKVEWEATGWAWGGRPLNVDEVEGAATLIQTELFAGSGMGDTDGETGVVLTLLGDGGRGSVSFEFAGTLEKGKRGFRAGLKAMWGYFDLQVGFGSQITVPKNMEAKEVEPFKCYWKDSLGEISVHFPTNGAMLPVPTPEEREEMDRQGRLDIREALNIFAACELPLLQDPNARIEIIGHADRPDATKRNEDLSENRAYSVLHYLHGILGHRLTYGLSYEEIAGYRLVVEGRGETEAQRDQDDDTKSDPKFRRVDLRVVIADPTKKTTKKTKKTKDEDENKDLVLELTIGHTDPASR